MRPRYAQPTAAHFLLAFGYAWLVIGFFLGTLTLAAIFRGALDRLHWGALAQDRLLVSAVLLLVIASFLLARWVVRTLFRRAPTTRNLVLFLLGVPAILCAFAWSDASRYIGRDRAVISTRVRQAF